MKLYGHVNRKSPNSFKVQVALAEAHASYQYIAVDLVGGAQRQPEFLSINSHGKVPVLVDPAAGFALPESDAILWYVAEKYPEAGLLPPPGDATPAALRQRARTLQWCDFASTAVYPAYADVYLHTAALALEKRSPAIAEAAMQRFLRGIGVMASALAAQPFLAGSYSIADIALAAVIQMARLRLSGDPANHPSVNAWMERVAARPAWRQTLASAGD